MHPATDIVSGTGHVIRPLEDLVPATTTTTTTPKVTVTYDYPTNCVRLINGVSHVPDACLTFADSREFILTCGVTQSQITLNVTVQAEGSGQLHAVVAVALTLRQTDVSVVATLDTSIQLTL